MSKKNNLFGYLRKLEHRISDLEVVNDKKLTLAKLHGSLSKAGNDLNTSLGRKYLRGKEFNSLHDNMNTAVAIITQKINPDFQPYQDPMVHTTDPNSTTPSEKKENIDDTVQIEGKSKFFGTVPSKPSRVV